MVQIACVSPSFSFFLFNVLKGPSFLFLTVQAACDNTAPATCYVSTSGTDTGDGSSPSDAVATIAYVLQKTGSQMVNIHLAAGTYVTDPIVIANRAHVRISGATVSVEPTFN